MNRNTLVALGIGLALGLALAVFLQRPQAQAQRPEAGPKWEYKVVVISGTDLVYGKRLEQMSQQLNEAAAEGWEYVGPVADRSPPAGSGSGAYIVESYIALRRPKK